MLLLLRCLGRHHKSDTCQAGQLVEDEKSSENSKQSDIIQENKLPKHPEAPTRTPSTPSTKSTKSSPRSPVMSWCSVTSVINFCHTFKSQEHPPTIEEPSQPVTSISPIIPIHPKLSDIGSTLSVTNTIQEAQEDEFYQTRQSYSDDPFAPPTPPGAHHGSFSTCSQTDISPSSLHSSRVEPLALTTSRSNKSPVLTLPDHVCLPNIDRLSKFDFNDWSSVLMGNSPVASALPARLRNPSISSLRMSHPSPTLTYRPQLYDSHPLTPPHSPLTQSVYSSHLGDSDHILFTQY